MSSAPQPRLLALTGVRIFLSLLIVLHHFAPVVVPLSPPKWRLALQQLLELPSVRVDMFFILSGMVMTYAYRRRLATVTVAALKQFWSHRLARVYPLHLLGLLLLVPGALGAAWLHVPQFQADHFTLSAFVAHLFLVQAWFPQVLMTWNAPSWSLSIEWAAYLLVPFTVGLVWRARPAALVVLSLLCALLPALYETVKPPPSPDLLQWPLLRGLGAFYLGTFLTPLLVRWGAPHAGQRFVAPVGLALVISSNVLTYLYGVSVLWSVPAAAALLLGLAWGRDNLSAFLQRPACLFWSQRSYALYMTHYLWLLFSRVVVHKVYGHVDSLAWPLKLGVLAFYLLPPLLVADLAHRCIELPARQWLDRLLAVQKPKLTIVAAAND